MRLRAHSDGKRLPMRLLAKAWGAHVRNPDLNGAQTLFAQPYAMGAHLFAGRLGLARHGFDLRRSTLAGVSCAAIVPAVDRRNGALIAARPAWGRRLARQTSAPIKRR